MSRLDEKWAKKLAPCSYEAQGGSMGVITALAEWQRNEVWLHVVERMLEVSSFICQLSRFSDALRTVPHSSSARGHGVHRHPLFPVRLHTFCFSLLNLSHFSFILNSCLKGRVKRDLPLYAVTTQLHHFSSPFPTHNTSCTHKKRFMMRITCI